LLTLVASILLHRLPLGASWARWALLFCLLCPHAAPLPSFGSVGGPFERLLVLAFRWFKLDGGARTIRRVLF